MGEIAEAVRGAEGGGEDAWMDVRSLARRLEEERIALIMAARSSYDEKERKKERKKDASTSLLEALSRSDQNWRG